MMHRAIQASLVSGCLLLAGCSGGGDDDAAKGGSGGTTGGTSGAGGATGGTGGGTGGTGGTGGGTGGTGGATGGTGGATSGTGGGGTSSGTTITASDANNYKFHSELTIDVAMVKPSTELHFDWSGVKKDLLGHDVDLTEIGMVEIGLWKLTLEQFEKKLNDDTLAQSDLVIIATILPPTPGATTGSIYDLTETGQPVAKSDIDHYLDITAYPPEQYMYTAMVANGTDLGKGTRMIQGFKLDSSSTLADVKVTSASTSLTMTADMHSLTNPTAPAGTPAISIDWDGMTKTAAGLEFDPDLITELRVGKYTMSVADMEKQENFLNLDALADTLYRAPVTAGHSIDLSKAKDVKTGNPFPGIDGTSNWVVALNCGDCANPAPWYLTLVKAAP